MATNATTPAPLPAPSAVLLTVSQFAAQQPALPESSIRWAIFHADANGLKASGAIVRAGRRVLIDPALYMAWLRTNPRLSPPGAKPPRPRAVAVLGDDAPPPRARRRAQPQAAA